MMVILEKQSTGIHDFIAVAIQDPKVEDIGLIKEVLEVVEKYNKIQIEKA